MNAKKILEKLVSFDTVCDKENEKIMSWIKTMLVKKGFDVRLQKDESTSKYNLIAQYSVESDNVGVSFVGHTDTVPAGDGWHTNPFALVEKNDKYYGLGASDMKGGIAAFLYVIMQCDVSRLQSSIDIMLTFDEEISFGGIKTFLSENDVQSDIIIVGEPTENIPIVATKGVVMREVVFSGKSVHGSRPADGVSAIYDAVHFINEIKKFTKDVLEKEMDDLFSPNVATLNVGKINGGDAVNKVPDQCNVSLEWRVIDDAQEVKINKEINAVFKDIKGAAKIQDAFNMPVMKIGNDDIARIEKLLGVQAKSENYATEASLINQNDNKNIIILGPGPMTGHVVNEYIDIESFEKSIKQYQKIIDRYCL